MQLILATNVNLNENENEKYTYIIHFQWHPKIDENVIIFAIWKLVQGPLDTMWHLFNLICKVIKPSHKCTCN
jgi:hypothetical protein